MAIKIVHINISTPYTRFILNNNYYQEVYVINLCFLHDYTSYVPIERRFSFSYDFNLSSNHKNYYYPILNKLDKDKYKIIGYMECKNYLFDFSDSSVIEKICIE